MTVALSTVDNLTHAFHLPAPLARPATGKRWQTTPRRRTVVA